MSSTWNSDMHECSLCPSWGWWIFSHLPDHLVSNIHVQTSGCAVAIFTSIPSTLLVSQLRLEKVHHIPSQLLACRSQCLAERHHLLFKASPCLLFSLFSLLLFKRMENMTGTASNGVIAAALNVFILQDEAACVVMPIPYIMLTLCELFALRCLLTAILFFFL